MRMAHTKLPKTDPVLTDALQPKEEIQTSGGTMITSEKHETQGPGENCHKRE